MNSSNNTRTVHIEDNQTNGKCLSNKTIDLLIGSDSSCTMSCPLDSVVYFLNRSNYLQSLKILQANYLLDTIKLGAVYGFKFKDDSKYGYLEKYVIYRLNDFVGNLNSVNSNEVTLQLLKSFDPPNKLDSLQGIEYDELGFKTSSLLFWDSNSTHKLSDRSLASKIINKIKHFDNYEQKKRLLFLLGKSYLHIGQKEKALQLFDYLIKSNYYAIPSFRLILEYLYINRDPLFNKYHSMYLKLYPDECDFSLIASYNNRISLGDSMKTCKSCLGSIFQKDSFRLVLKVANSYLNRKQFNKVDELISGIEDKNKDIDLWDTFLDEKGYYLDIKMRSLFLQKRYKELYDFSKNDLDYNTTIRIENNDDFRNYIHKIYSEYKIGQEDNFIIFFKKNYSFVKNN